MKAYLFDDFMVEIDPLAARIGGSFQGRRDGVPCPWDDAAIKFFWSKVKNAECPLVLDIGANTGSFSLLATIHSSMWVCAFEPASVAYDLLLKNRALNGGLCAGITTFNFALSDYHGEADLNIPDGPNSGLATLGDPQRVKSSISEKVNVRQLDEYHFEPDYIKIDTEGAELMVLRGGEKTIRRHRPKMLIEFYNQNTRQFGYEPEEITELLSSWGAKVERATRQDIWVTWR